MSSEQQKAANSMFVKGSASELMNVDDWSQTLLGGVLCVCEETTKRVANRQFQRKLVAQPVEAACQLCLSATAKNPDQMSNLGIQLTP